MVTTRMMPVVANGLSTGETTFSPICSADIVGCVTTTGTGFCWSGCGAAPAGAGEDAWGGAAPAPTPEPII